MRLILSVVVNIWTGSLNLWAAGRRRGHLIIMSSHVTVTNNTLPCAANSIWCVLVLGGSLFLNSHHAGLPPVPLLSHCSRHWCTNMYWSWAHTKEWACNEDALVNGVWNEPVEQRVNERGDDKLTSVTESNYSFIDLVLQWKLEHHIHLMFKVATLLFMCLNVPSWILNYSNTVNVVTLKNSPDHCETVSFVAADYINVTVGNCWAQCPHTSC